MKYWFFKLLAGLLCYCSGLWAVSYELQKTWCVSCTLHLTSSILHLTNNFVLHLTSWPLHLASCILQKQWLVSCILLLMCRFYANCGSWVLSASQPKFVIMPLFPISCDYLCLIARVWRFDHWTGRHGWFGWAFSDVNLMWSCRWTFNKPSMIRTWCYCRVDDYHKCLPLVQIWHAFSMNSQWCFLVGSWSRQRSLIEICFHLLLVSQPFDCHGKQR